MAKQSIDDGARLEQVRQCCQAILHRRIHRLHSSTDQVRIQAGPTRRDERARFVWKHQQQNESTTAFATAQYPEFLAFKGVPLAQDAYRFRNVLERGSV